MSRAYLGSTTSSSIEFAEVDLVVDPTERHERAVSPITTSSPGVDPGTGAAGDVDDVVALVGGELARPHAAPAGLADDVRRSVGPEAVEVVGDRGERDQQGARHVPGGVLVGLADVDHERALGDAFGERGNLDLRNRHGAKANRPGPLRSVVNACDAKCQAEAREARGSDSFSDDIVATTAVGS